MVGGLKQNDVILEIDGNKVESIMDVSKFIMMSTDNLIDFKIKRSYDELILKIKPETGKTLIWPAEWTHAHAGEILKFETKYIITGWMCFPVD